MTEAGADVNASRTASYDRRVPSDALETIRSVKLRNFRPIIKSLSNPHL